MGFFSGALKTLTGGSESSQSSQSGFALLPKEIQDTFKNFSTNVNGLINSNYSSAFTPLQQTADETNAFNALRTGFAPNQASVASDIALQTNPFDSYVIDGINREAGGNYSILKQALSEAGQLGSNRQALGANDIDLTRLQQIGQFKQGQYNTALNNALTTLPNARSQDAQNLLGIGQFERGLASQTNQAPYTALEAIAKILGVLPTNGGSTSTQKANSSGGLASLFSGGGGGS